MRKKRLGVSVWVKNTRAARHLRRFGHIHYVSKRMNYVCMYVDAEDIERTIQQLQKLEFVTKVERSHWHEVPTEYSNAKPDKAKEYDYKMGL
ncbi:YlbG family protein [Bacillaceae bacterium]